MKYAHPLNVAAIRDWYAEHRPDALPIFDALLERDAAGDRVSQAIVATVLQGFEAGRAFQSRHPEFPLGGGLHYQSDSEGDPS